MIDIPACTLTEKVKESKTTAVYRGFLDADERKSLIGSGDRSQRIRTYNFPENRVTDHRINKTFYQLDQIVAGNVQPLTDALIDHDREELRGSMGLED